MIESHTAVVERDAVWSGDYATEPYEVAWAREAIFFVRTLSEVDSAPHHAKVQLSPDGRHWCDEGSSVEVPATAGVGFVRLRHFGGWLRLSGSAPQGISLRVHVYLALKG